jgi:hypothetical protein
LTTPELRKTVRNRGSQVFVNLTRTLNDPTGTSFRGL